MCFSIFRKKSYPIWAYGLECHICEMTFISEKAHYEEVIKRNTLKEHEGKIPQLT